MKARLFSKAALAAILGAVLLSAGHAATLRDAVQQKLDAHPALVQQELKMRVMQEQSGSVVLELNQGPKILRDLLRKGIEINGAGMRDADLKQEELVALRCIRMAVQAVKAIDGVTDVSLTGSINPLDPAENDYNQASKQMAEGNSAEREEANQILKRAAAAGFPAAQCDLAGYYLVDGGGRPDAEKALYWYRRAAELGEPRAQFNLGKMLATGRETSHDYPEALKWLRKAAAQDRQILPKAKGLTSLAMLLVTCPNASLRNPKEAETALSQAEVIYGDNPVLFEVRAAVAAACRRFPEAVEQQKKWVVHLQSATNTTVSDRDARVNQALQRLSLYEKGRLDVEGSDMATED